MQKKISELSNNQTFIRNISIISHVDHGKTTLSDYLLASGGLLPENLAGSLRALDNLPEEQRRGITIESSFASYIINYDQNNYLINLIDTPGHVDFSGKVAESLRIVDGSLIIVDAVEGIMAQTKSVLKQAINEEIEFVLFINKIDRLITELELNSSQIQLKIQKIVSEIHRISISLGIKKEKLPNFKFGTILLGSALDGWAIGKDYTDTGKNIQNIINLYKNNEKFSEEMKLSSVLNKAIIHKFPSPQEGQKNKFPSLLKHRNNNIINILTSCDPNSKPILIIGRQERNLSNIKNSYISRVLSGTISKGMKLKSSITKGTIKIQRLTHIHGRNRINRTEAFAGNICIVSFSEHLTSGDILHSNSIGDINLKDISYIQDPVIAIGIEPVEINQIGKFQKMVANICEYTPGLYFEINKLTGELIVLGVGTLQLDVLINDLKAMNFEIDVSTPIVISYEMPLENIEITETDIGVSFFAGVEIPTIMSEYICIYSDDQNNKLLIKNQIKRDGFEGLIEVFKQSCRISPNSGKRIKNFQLALHNQEFDPIFETYENAMIIGSKIIKEGLYQSKSLVHEPFYDLEIILPEKYIGNILQELQRLKAIISDVTSHRDNSKIIATLSVKEAISMADNIRQLSDGNAFWSYLQVRFLPIM